MSTSQTISEEKTIKPLQIYTLGQFMVRCGEQVISVDSNASKPWQLFLYLITNRDKPTPAEVIMDTLWPEQNYANSKQALQNLAYRLKQKLEVCSDLNGILVIRLSQGCYSLSDGENIWLDVKYFESLCRQAYKLKDSEPSLAIEKYQKALDMYRGDYLSESPPTEWIVPTRQFYRRLLMRSASELLRLLKKDRRVNELTTICEEMFLIDPYEEDLHLNYMEALMESGKTSKAQAHYQYITTALYQEIGVAPSDAMRNLYRAMKSKRDQSHLGFNDIQEMLQQREEFNGAMLCDSQKFQFLSKLERRKAVRGGFPVHVGLLALTGTASSRLTASEQEDSKELLKKVLLHGLRKGDVFSQIMDSQFVVLLSGQDLKQSKEIINRLRKEFMEKCTNKEILLRCSIYPFMS